MGEGRGEEKRGRELKLTFEKCEDMLGIWLVNIFFLFLFLLGENCNMSCIDIVAHLIRNEKNGVYVIILSQY